MIDLSAYKPEHREFIAYTLKFLPHEEDVPEAKEELEEFYRAIECADLDKARHIMWALSSDSLQYANTFYTAYLELDAIMWDVKYGDN